MDILNGFSGINLSWVKEWQPLVGSVLGSIFGFGGIILTLRYNAKKDRALQQTKIDADRHLAVEKELAERRGLLIVIRAELENYLHELHSMVRPVGEGTNRDLLVPPSLYPPIVFEANISRLGSVGGDVALIVVKAYGMLPGYANIIDFVIKGLRRYEKIDQIGSGNFAIPSIHAPTIEKATSQFVLVITMAMDAIDNELKKLPATGS